MLCSPGRFTVRENMMTYTPSLLIKADGSHDVNVITRPIAPELEFAGRSVPPVATWWCHSARYWRLPRMITGSKTDEIRAPVTSSLLTAGTSP